MNSCSSYSHGPNNRKQKIHQIVSSLNSSCTMHRMYFNPFWPNSVSFIPTQISNLSLLILNSLGILIWHYFQILLRTLFINLSWPGALIKKIMNKCPNFSSPSALFFGHYLNFSRLRPSFNSGCHTIPPVPSPRNCN